MSSKRTELVGWQVPPSTLNYITELEAENARLRDENVRLRAALPPIDQWVALHKGETDE
jgi:hypothetical protein